MELRYNEHGNLVPGFYDMSLEKVGSIFCFNRHRAWLFEGVKLAIEDLKKIDCKTVYLDGSYVTKIELPKDFDMCWDDTGLDLVKVSKICPPLFDCGWKMKKMKARYRGDVAPANSIADMDKGINFLGFFTEDKQGRDKGIIRISIA
jgi:hypothetical protein